MKTASDGVDVVHTPEQAAGLELAPLLVLDPLRHYFDAHGLGGGDLTWQRIGEGQANLTYLIVRDGERFVLRRGPRPPHPPSTHDMVREARIQKLVARSGVPVPEIVSVCEDPAILGVPFYVMRFLEGEVITDPIPAALDAPEERRRTALAAVDALVELHAIDVSSGELSSIGRPDGYLERQVRRFSALWDQSTERSLPELHEVGAWLGAHVPRTQRPSVVHGDYRLGNLMFAADAPARVAAILDWEMATLGDPLADLGYFTATYAVPGGSATPIELTSVTRLAGYPDRSELIERYADRTGLDVSDLAWYQALALFKAAIFCEAMYTRWLHGERPGDTFAPTLAEGIPAMIADARQFIRHA
ncbi:phosphotransferase family protein [Microbacterium thalassium]|uniref:Aminoglycoside phosphotransferase (APT) family kinase protein n=1 Tax=Microbacterium thalassium TaxID=362649 RepID=A0A7X0FN57_9MICO|nr:phosphotransferase family protein [Microbacterium thalassium]MBB6390494.1 aminoglycoside phosphotransferase (APT) family kinase protein [Microbacterium thalassium]GLK25604.1 acyl-CoA dehydrogenase [Microbacterium thalassium]